MTLPDFEAMLADYPELLRWRDLEKVLGFSRRTLERRRAQGKLRVVVFVDPFGDGCLQATKESVIQFLEGQAARTAKNLTPPSLMEARAGA